MFDTVVVIAWVRPVRWSQLTPASTYGRSSGTPLNLYFPTRRKLPCAGAGSCIGDGSRDAAGAAEGTVTEVTV